MENDVKSKKPMIIAIILLVILAIAVIVVGVLISKKANKEKSPEEVKDVLKKEQEFIKGELYGRNYFDVEGYKKSGPDVYWEESQPKTINIKGKIVKGTEVSDDMAGDSLILTEEGELYFQNSDEAFKRLSVNYKVNRIGYYAVNGSGECEYAVSYALDTDDGMKYLEENPSNGALVIKKIPSEKSFMLPTCHPREETNFMMGDDLAYMRIHNDGKIGFSYEMQLKDKKTKKNIEAKFILYLDDNKTEKYYIVDQENVLYIVTKPEEYIESLVKLDKVEAKVNEAASEDDDPHATVKLTYQDIVLEFNNLEIA